MNKDKEKELEKHIQVERSIIKRFRKEIWKKFIEGINQYEMIKDGDKIAVCISGGKDSFLMAKLFQELKKHGRNNFDVVFLVMNPGYNEKNLELIKYNSKDLAIDVNIFESDIFDIVDKQIDGSPCYLCARMRRGCLYSKAKELGCNKIALGHHFDDVIETILLSMFYGGEMKTMMPKLHSTNFEGMELIRPMYFVKEQDILDWVKYNDLKFLNCACKFTEKSSYDENLSKRKEMKRLISDYRKIYENVDYCIFKSSENVNMDAILGYRKDGEKHSFLEKYDEI